MDKITIKASFVKGKKKMIKINRNQLAILDALMIHGGYKVYDSHNISKYSEHSGALDFDNKGLEMITVSTKKGRKSKDDKELLFPNINALFPDYEYIFHTHPPTPYIGGRASRGVLYEMPSIPDIFHFIDHHEQYGLQGSIIIAPEGMYIIRIHGKEGIKVDNEQVLFDNMGSVMYKVQRDAIKKYGTDIKITTFYNDIAQNKKFINDINKVLNIYGLGIDYIPRVKVGRKWILDTVILPVSPVEPSLIKKAIG